MINKAAFNQKTSKEIIPFALRRQYSQIHMPNGSFIPFVLIIMKILIDVVVGMKKPVCSFRFGNGLSRASIRKPFAPMQSAVAGPLLSCDSPHPWRKTAKVPSFRTVAEITILIPGYISKKLLIVAIRAGIDLWSYV